VDIYSGRLVPVAVSSLTLLSIVDVSLKSFRSLSGTAGFLVLLLSVSTLVPACGGTGPRAPTLPPVVGPGEGPPSNSVPVIASIEIRGSRINEPANFADVGETVVVGARVSDAETPLDQLQYTW
jgi:hypothetical protein